MKKHELENRFKMNLQLFADGDESDTGEKDKGKEKEKDEPGDESDDEEDDEQEKKKEKTYTESQLQRKLAREKKQGRNSVLNELGLKSDDIPKFKTVIAALLGNETKDNNSTKDKSTAKEDNDHDTMTLAEKKLICYDLGVKKEDVADLVAIIDSKVTKDKDFEDVLEELKDNKRYKTFFKSEDDEGGKDDSGGTGKPPRGSKGKKEKVTFASRFAENAKKEKAKSKYFD